MPSFVRIAAFATGLFALAAGIPGASAPTPHGHSFHGVPYTGTLFSEASGLGSHFCTASVVASPAGNLLITSAHCITNRPPATVGFAPGYHGSKAPYGTFPVTAVFTDQAWTASHSVDDDVAILEVGQNVQQRTGALSLATGDSPRASTVLGYPDGTAKPVTCTARATWFTRGHQMKFVCRGYPEGTSGGPWITGGNRVYGIIGGYQQGGNVPWISYSPYFGSNIRALYNQVVAQDR